MDSYGEITRLVAADRAHPRLAARQALTRPESRRPPISEGTVVATGRRPRSAAVRLIRCCTALYVGLVSLRADTTNLTNTAADKEGTAPDDTDRRDGP
jgi:hypothetical protein